MEQIRIHTNRARCIVREKTSGKYLQVNQTKDAAVMKLGSTSSGAGAASMMPPAPSYVLPGQNFTGISGIYL